MSPTAGHERAAQQAGELARAFREGDHGRLPWLYYELSKTLVDTADPDDDTTLDVLECLVRRAHERAEERVSAPSALSEAVGW